MSVPDLDATTETLALSLENVDRVSLGYFNKILDANVVSTSDDLLELDAITAQLDAYMEMIVDNPKFLTSVEDAKQSVALCSTSAEEWQHRRNEMGQHFTVGTEVKTDDMSNLLHTIIKVRDEIRDLNKLLTGLRKQAQDLLTFKREEEEMNEKFRNLSYAVIVEPAVFPDCDTPAHDMPSVVRSKMLHEIYRTRKAKLGEEENHAVRQKEFTEHLLHIVRDCRNELNSLLKNAQLKITDGESVQDEAFVQLISQIPEHLCTFDDILASKNFVVDDAMGDYHEQILSAIEGASRDFGLEHLQSMWVEKEERSSDILHTDVSDIVLEESHIPHGSTADNDSKGSQVSPTAYSPNPDEDDTTRESRRREYRDFLKFNLGPVPFPPLHVPAFRPSAVVVSTSPQHDNGKSLFKCCSKTI